VHAALAPGLFAAGEVEQMVRVTRRHERRVERVNGQEHVALLVPF
jgi:hypothetical protein